MTTTDLADFNARWLAAWSAKDVEALLAFYAPDTLYKDPQVPEGVVGHAALRDYLVGLFGSTPPMTFVPHEIWPTEAGYCGRWYCTIDVPDSPPAYMRGFDLVVMKDGLIALNEVYTHDVAAAPAA